MEDLIKLINKLEKKLFIAMLKAENNISSEVIDLELDLKMLRALSSTYIEIRNKYKE